MIYMQDGLFNITATHSAGRQHPNTARILFNSRKMEPDKIVLGFIEKNVLAKRHIAFMLSTMSHDECEKTRSFLNNRSAELVRTRNIEEGGQFIQLLFELRTRVLFSECERMLEEVANGTITYSYDIYSSLEKNRAFDIVSQLRKEASSLLSRLPQVREYKSAGSHLNYYKKAANIAAHYTVLKTLCSMEEFDSQLSPLDYYFVVAQQHDYSSKEVRHLNNMKYLLILSELEFALQSRSLEVSIEPGFTSEILKMPFYSREFL